MSIIFTLILIGFVLFLFYCSDKLSNKEFNNKSNESGKNINLLINELKNIDQMKFEIVSSEIMYSKTVSIVLKTVAYILSVWVSALLLDLITAKTLFIFDDHLTGFVLTFMAIFALTIIFILPLASLTWKYTYFKYGLNNQIKYGIVISDLLKPLPKKIFKNYVIVSMVFYVIGRLTFGAGVFSVEAGSVLYALYLNIFYHLEIKRIGFAPVFNLFTEKLNEFRGKHGK